MIANDQSEFSLRSIQRNSFDNDINNHGKRLLEICRSADLRILNGRVNGDSLGRPTFHGRNGISVIDYAICDQDLFTHIANFIVKEPLCLSDHNPIVTWLNINTNFSSRDTSFESDNLVPRVSLLPVQRSERDGKKRDPGNEVAESDTNAFTKTIFLGK